MARRRRARSASFAGRIYLAAGALRVMPATFVYHEFRHAEDLERLDEIVTHNSDIQLGTGHPHGGNALSRDPSTGVVDPRRLRALAPRIATSSVGS